MSVGGTEKGTAIVSSAPYATTCNYRKSNVFNKLLIYLFFIFTM